MTAICQLCGGDLDSDTLTRITHRHLPGANGDPYTTVDLGRYAGACPPQPDDEDTMDVVPLTPIVAAVVFRPRDTCPLCSAPLAVGIDHVAWPERTLDTVSFLCPKHGEVSRLDRLCCGFRGCLGVRILDAAEGEPGDADRFLAGLFGSLLSPETLP